MDNQQPNVNDNLFYQKPKEGHGYIYKYTSPSGKSYIGKTINNLKTRAKNIISGNGYKKCTVFWRAIQKYGWNNFSVEILEECLIEELDNKERYYINKFNSLIPNGYNQTIGGEGGKRRPVYVYSAQNGEFIEFFSSLSEASLVTNVPIETISTILNTERRSQSHNLVFMDKYIPYYDVKTLKRNKCHHLYVYDKDGNYYDEFNSIVDAAKALNVGESSIQKVLSGRALHASYYQFQNKKFDKISPIPKNNKTPISVCQKDPKTLKTIAIYPSLASAARAVGLTSGDGIKKVLERGRGTSGGYFWELNGGSTTKCLENPTKTAQDSSKMDEDIV